METIAFIIGLIFGVGIGTVWAENVDNRSEVAHHCGHYDSQTAKFTWNDEEIK